MRMARMKRIADRRILERIVTATATGWTDIATGVAQRDYVAERDILATAAMGKWEETITTCASQQKVTLSKLSRSIIIVTYPTIKLSFCVEMGQWEKP